MSMAGRLNQVLGDKNRERRSVSVYETRKGITASTLTPKAVPFFIICVCLVKGQIYQRFLALGAGDTKHTLDLPNIEQYKEE